MKGLLIGMAGIIFLTSGWGAEVRELRVFNLLPVGSARVDLRSGEHLWLSGIKPGYWNEAVHVPAGAVWGQQGEKRFFARDEGGGIGRSTLVIFADSSGMRLQIFPDTVTRRPKLRIWVGSRLERVGLDLGTWGKWDQLEEPGAREIQAEYPPPERIRLLHRLKSGELLIQDYEIPWDRSTLQTLVISERGPDRLRVRLFGEE